MNLHLQGFKQNEPNKKGGFQKQTSFISNDLTALYRMMWLTILLAFFSVGAWAQGGGGRPSGGGPIGGGGCSLSFSTNLNTTPYNVTVNGTAPTLTVAATGYPTFFSYNWYSSPDGNLTNNSWTLVATGTSYTPDVSTIGTLYYAVDVTNSCGTVTSHVAKVIVTAGVTQPVAGTISGGANVCTGTNSTTLTISGYTGTIQWQSSTDNTTFTDISGATSASYTATNLSATTWYQAVVSSGGLSATATSVAVTVNPNASAGTVSAGTNPQCAGSTTTYTVSGTVLSGGTGEWSSSNIAVATVDQTGKVTAVSAGTCNIVYTVTGATCGGPVSASQPYIVNPTANSGSAGTIAGSNSLCIGSSTPFTVSGTVLGGGTGAWSSDNLGVATVDASGNVTAISAGTCYITYTVTGGCGFAQSLKQITVNPNASAGTVSAGTSPQCIGSSTTYTVSGTVLSGGTGAWSSSNTALATVDASTGVVSAIGGGTCNIVYTVTGATCGGTQTASQPYTVNPNASAGSVSGVTTPQCIGTTITYTVSGAILSGGIGAWSSDNTAVATVDPSGNVTAISAGTSNIVYTVTGATCGGTVSASQPYTVNPNASAGTVSAGTSPQCVGSTTTYKVTGAELGGGTGGWSSDNTAVATVDPSSGVVTAVGGGTCNIIYTVTGGCGGTQTASQPYSVISGIDASANSNPVALGSAVSLTATISPAISGVTVTFNLDPGTGIITTYTAVTNTSGVATTSPISGLSVNVYKVIATAAGCAISNAAYLPVYDPNSSFVTGGGWIISPAGALVAQPLLSGKANFGFVAKYQKGKNKVNGHTEFDFQEGNFNFTSSSLNPGTLVISGAKATYRGVGIVNGTGNYGFMVSAVDGQINGGGGTDLFRIKIWDISNGNTLVYDNNMGKDENGAPTTALGGGSIVIHYAKNAKSRMMGSSSGVEIVNNNNSNQHTGSGKLTVKVMSNPSSYHFSLELNSLSKENVKIIVSDIIGRVIDMKTDVPANSTIQLGDNYHQGIYIAELLQGNDRVTLRLLKIGNQ